MSLSTMRQETALSHECETCAQPERTWVESGDPFGTGFRMVPVPMLLIAGDAERHRNLGHVVRDLRKRTTSTGPRA
jgi:hypothetical protein